MNSTRSFKRMPTGGLAASLIVGEQNRSKVPYNAGLYLGACRLYIVYGKCRYRTQLTSLSPAIMRVAELFYFRHGKAKQDDAVYQLLIQMLLMIVVDIAPQEIHFWEIIWLHEFSLLISPSK